MANKKFTINTLMESIPEVTKTELKFEDECFKDVTVQVRHTLPLEDAINYVKDIYATCVDDEQADFMPELFDFAVRMYTVMYYANIDLSKDVKKAYRILYDTALFRQVYECANMEQINNLIMSAEKRIEHWRNIVSSSMAGKVAELMNKMESVISGSEEMMDAINGEEFQAAINRLAGDGVLPTADNRVSEDDVAKAANLMSGLLNNGASDGSSNIISIKTKK